MFIQSKKKRKDLRLPILHYTVADDWVDKLGYSAFVAWLKFHTWVNRADEKLEDINRAKIPMSMEKVAEKLGVGKTTLYTKIVPVLWEYGLIDLIEYEDSTRKSQKPVNIIPYDYPQNNSALEKEILEKCRDWKKDYNTRATFYARKGGRNIVVEAPLNRSKIRTVDGSQIRTVDGSKTRTVTVQENEPNNYTNNSINISNDFINHSSNNLLMDDEETPPTNIVINEDTMLEGALLKSELLKFDLEETVIIQIVQIAEELEISLYPHEIGLQLRDMKIELEIEMKTITNYPLYFIKGIMMKRQTWLNNKKQLMLERLNQTSEKENRQPVKMSNWLEN